MHETTESTGAPHQQPRHRAVFSQEDFSLLKAAVALYAKEIPAGTDAIKYANLYHRLSRIA